MTANSHPPSLRREIILWYSAVLLVALVLFAAFSYLLLDQALTRAGTTSLRQTAAAAEQLVIPSGVPRIATREERVPPGPGDLAAIRRRTQLATGEIVDIYVARSGDVQSRALRMFLLISLVLIPITAIAAAAGGRRVADRLLRPLNRLVLATREVQIEALSRRVEVPERPAELQELAHAFNAMLSRLERAVEALQRFTADASHELRTPLAAIKGTAQVALARERTAEELRGTLSEVVEECEGMLHLVEGLLTLARGEGSEVHHVLATFNLVPLLEDITEIGQALATGSPVEVRLDAPPELSVVGAPAPLRQVFLNLVANAVRFTDQGSVIIRARSLEEGQIEVAVMDTGRGIPSEELPRVFDRFYRGEAARGSENGSGLGLAIARLIVEQHGGSIQVDSQPGQGSAFRVRLPA